MVQLTFSTADDSPCVFCEEAVAIDMTTCPSCEKEVLPRINTAELLELFYEGYVIDARAGGLVLGRHHEEDDIPMFGIVAPGIFQCLGVMQGGEYLVNRAAAAKQIERLKEINSYKSPEYMPMQSIKLTDASRVFNTNGLKDNLVLLVEKGAFIVNRAATSKFYYELEELNNSKE